MVGCRVHLFLLLVSVVQEFGNAALTDTNDFIALMTLKDEWDRAPRSWKGGNPCDNWDGISCSNNRVISITLVNIGLSGTLASDIDGLSALQILDLSYNKNMTGSIPSSIGNLSNLFALILVGCGFSGSIPESIGSLRELTFLSLNRNNFIGKIPPTLGLLPKLIVLDLADNKLHGTIPVSNGRTPGLDMLVHTRHFHLGNNQLNGEIPPKLFSSNMALIHLLLDNNQLTGSIPSSLGLVKTLQVLRLDRNQLHGSVPENLNNLTSVEHLHLSCNGLTGPLPNLTGMDALYFVDMSNNTFDSSDVPPWFSTLPSLTSLIMERANIEGQLPVTLFSLPQLQTVNLKNNRINGTLNIGTSYSSQLQLIDLENNRVDDFTQRAGGYTVKMIILVRNIICAEDGTQNYCRVNQQSDSSYTTPPANCMPSSCSSNKISSPNCKCAHPYSGNLYFRSRSFSNFGNKTLFESLELKLMSTFSLAGAPVDSVSLSNPTLKINGDLQLDLQLFPSEQNYFNESGISRVGVIFSNHTFIPPPGFGPYYFNGNPYPFFEGSGKPSNTGLIIGGAVAGSVLFVLLVLAGAYGLFQKRRAETATKKSDPFASWDSTGNSGSVPQLIGVKYFSFEELKKSTNHFSDDNNIGTGGYGKVYRGILPNGQLVAIKRAQHQSMQGAHEFKTEIELLSRVHHKNVVSLIGFCFDQGEQMLIYEFIANGTLKDSLVGRSGIRLDWTRRLRIALGAACGLQYLHDLADPPIIHRDIKSNNILLDERLKAKVADFGLSKLMGGPEKGHVTTQVKGTMGYLDPEYYMTQQLTEKSDVYSFGVLLLELVTGKPPIDKGKYIVREVKETMDKAKDLYNLQNLLDPIVANSNMAPRSLEKYVDLALRCVEDVVAKRPTMSEVAKEIESIMELIGLNPHAESASTSYSYEVETGKGADYPYSNKSMFYHSGSNPSSLVEPK